MRRYSEYVRKYTGNLKVGDIVKRRIMSDLDYRIMLKEGEYGIVVDRYMGGSPIHPCVDVMWGKGTPSSLGECYLELVQKESDDEKAEDR